MGKGKYMNSIPLHQSNILSQRIYELRLKHHFYYIYMTKIVGFRCSIIFQFFLEVIIMFVGLTWHDLAFSYKGTGRHRRERWVCLVILKCTHRKYGKWGFYIFETYMLVKPSVYKVKVTQYMLQFEDRWISN